MARLHASMMALNAPLSLWWRHQQDSKKSLASIHGNASSIYDGSPSLTGGERDSHTSMGIVHANTPSIDDGSHALALSLSLSLTLSL